ncbi:MAG TPA: cell division protein ZapA [Kofleriaceae bacterium]|nr:cell division protein ZapA [Kofleriaceae bacterium]
MSRSVKVSIAGFKLSLKTDAKPRYIKELAAYVTAKIEQARAPGKVATTQALALLAAMTIADELHQLRAEKAELERQVRERTQRILRTLEAEARASSSG